MQPNETERQRRESEKLVTPEDYKYLRSVYIDMYNGSTSYIRKAIKEIERGAMEKAFYIVDISRPYRRKQGIFSRWKDMRIEKTIAAQAEEENSLNGLISQNEEKIQQLEHILQENNLLPGPKEEPALEEPPKKGILGFFRRKSTKKLTLEAQNQKIAELTAACDKLPTKPVENDSDCEVVESDEVEDEEPEVDSPLSASPSKKEDDDDDEVLKF